MTFKSHLYILNLTFLYINSLTHASAREFTVEDIRVYPQVTDQPFPNAFKCFTCNNADDNYNCNTQSPDEWCDEESFYCKSEHVFETDWLERKRRLNRSRAMVAAKTSAQSSRRIRHQRSISPKFNTQISDQTPSPTQTWSSVTVLAIRNITVLSFRFT